MSKNITKVVKAIKVNKIPTNFFIIQILLKNMNYLCLCNRLWRYRRLSVFLEIRKPISCNTCTMITNKTIIMSMICVFWR